MQKVSLRFACLAVAMLGASANPAALAAKTRDELPGLSQAASDQASGAARGADLIAFDYEELFDRATQLGLLTQQLGYTLDVAADGTATGCKLSRTFRSGYVAKELCKQLMRSASFQPARDAQGNATAGAYQGQVQIYSFFQPSR